MNSPDAPVLATGGAGFLGGMLSRLLHESRNNVDDNFMDTAEIRGRQSWRPGLICERVQISASPKAGASRTGNTAKYFTGPEPRLPAGSGF